MNPRWLAIPALVILAGCKLDPAASYRKAAKQLTFTLEQVDPRFQLATPLDQSKLLVHLTVKADNPSTVRFKARSIHGDITLDADGSSHYLGQLDCSEGVDILPAAQTPVAVDLTFNYQDLRNSGMALRSLVSGTRSGTWHLDGKMGLDVLGIPLTVPLKVKKKVGGP